MKIEKFEKLLANLYDKTLNMLKQALNHGLALRKVHRVIKFNRNFWLKPYIYMNSNLRRKSKNDFLKDFFKLLNCAVFGKSMENVRKNRDIKLITTKGRKNYLVLEPTYHFTKFSQKTC